MKSNLFSAQVLVAVVATILFMPVAVADTQEGGITGVVIDRDTIPLPGVLLSVVGPYLQGERKVTTDREGRYRFPLIPVGTGYAVAAVLDGYQRVIQTDIQVIVGAGTRLDFTLIESSGDLGEVIVTAVAPLVDTKRTAIGEIITQGFLEHLPSNRMQLDATWMVGGVAGYGNIYAHGADSTDNVFLVDGVDTTDNATGTFGMVLSQEAIQEVEMKTGAFEAEYGRATGAISNVVTKSGGNHFHGALPLHFSDIALKQHQQSDRTWFVEQDFYRVDTAASLGGPLLPDRVWFFTSYDRRANRYSGDNFYGEPVSWSSVTQWELAKVSWQLNPDNKIVAQYAADPYTTGSIGARYEGIMSSAYGKVDTRSELSKLQWTSILNPNMFLETKAAFHKVNITYGPENAADDDPIITDLQDGDGFLQYGNVWMITSQHRPRIQFQSVLNLYTTDRAGDHNLRMGVEYQDMAMEEHTTFPDWYQINIGTDRHGEEKPDTWTRRTRLDANNGGYIMTAFAHDAWTFNQNWTFNLGLRWETQEQHNDMGERVYLFDNLVAPRTGLSWDLKGDGSSKLFLNFGRYYDAVGSYLGWAMNRKGSESWQWEGDYESGAWEEISHTTPEQNPTQVDPDLKPSFKDEIVFGYEWEFAVDMSVGLKGIFNRQDNMIEDIISNEAEVRSGETDEYWYYITNLPQARRKYRGLEFSLKKRLSNHYQFMVFYTLSKAKGSIANQSQYEGLNYYGDFAETMHNAYGYLPWDDLHYLKFHGAYHLPWGLILGCSGAWRSGRPFNRIGLVSRYIDDTNVFDNYWYSYFVDPRGSHRLGHVWWIDLRLTKDFNLADTELSVIIDAFNISNNQFVVGRHQWDDQLWGQASTWQGPGTFVLGLKCSF